MEGNRVADVPGELCKIMEMGTHTQPPGHSGPDSSILNSGNLAATEAEEIDARKQFRLKVTILLTECTR